jgi:hypothetical protein
MTLLFITCPETTVSVSFSTKSTVPNISATTITRQNAKHKRVRRSGKADLQILAFSLNPPKPRKPSSLENLKEQPQHRRPGFLKPRKITMKSLQPPTVNLRVA